MNLLIDIGNTRYKVATIDNAGVFAINFFSSESEVISFFKLITVEKAIIAAVTNNYTQIVNYLRQVSVKTIIFDSETILPLKNKYKTSYTLGSDRLAAAIGALMLFPHSDVLTIDAGTCVKYNFVTANNEFIGGAISPGLSMRLKALNTFTAKLPLLEIKSDNIALIGATTEESMLSGVIIGAASEIDGIIDRYKLEYPKLKLVICGGDAPLLQKHLKNSIFAEPNLVLIGLNALLELNT